MIECLSLLKHNTSVNQYSKLSQRYDTSINQICGFDDTFVGRPACISISVWFKFLGKVGLIWKHNYRDFAWCRVLAILVE